MAQIRRLVDAITRAHVETFVDIKDVDKFRTVGLKLLYMFYIVCNRQYFWPHLILFMSANDILIY